MNMKTPEQRFLDAQIALLRETPEAELDELLQAAGLDPNDLAARGEEAVSRALAVIEQARSASAALAGLSAERQREVSKHLRVRRSVLAALTERRAHVDSIPQRFLNELAKEVSVPPDGMRLALSGQAFVSASVHKADKAPQPPKQVSFAQLLRDAEMSEQEIAELLRDDD